jgi:hypothetical protein
MSLADLQPAEGEKFVLNSSQQQQLDSDLKLLLPKGYDGKNTPKSRRLAESGVKGEASKEVSVENPKVEVTRTGAWRVRQFPLGGWVYHDVPYRWQREDQGQDFEIPMGHHIIAPGWGHCVSHLSDRPWPNGFGSPYMVVYIGSGKFAGHLWYIGHNNYVQIRVGESFNTGRILSMPDHEMNAGWGWTELGIAPNGYPGPWGGGAANHWRFAPIWRWSH